MNIFTKSYLYYMLSIILFFFCVKNSTFVLMKIIKDSDIILFEKIKHNSQPAFDELFNKYYQNLCEFSYHIVKNKSCAEEIVADVFANIWIKRKKIKIKTKLSSYLYRSTKNTSISYLRKNKVQFEPLFDSRDFIAKPDAQPDRAIIKNENKLRLDNLLNILPERNKEIFVLHRFSGLKYVEIADIVGISVKTVEKHMSKSLKLLRETYKKKSQII